MELRVAWVILWFEGWHLCIVEVSLKQKVRYFDDRSGSIVIHVVQHCSHWLYCSIIIKFWYLHYYYQLLERKCVIYILWWVVFLLNTLQTYGLSCMVLSMVRIIFTCNLCFLVILRCQISKCTIKCYPLFRIITHIMEVTLPNVKTPAQQNCLVHYISH